MVHWVVLSEALLEREGEGEGEEEREALPHLLSLEVGVEVTVA